MTLKMFFILSACVVIFAIIRALKSDTPIPWTVPPKWRPLLAVLLGQIGAGIAALVKLKWPNLPIGYEDIFEAGVGGSAFSALLNGLLQTKEAIAEKTPPVVASVRPPPLPPLPIILLLIVASCSPAANRTAAKEAQADIEITSYGAEVAKCRTEARAGFDSCVASGITKLDCKVKNMDMFDACACKADAKYSHDAGVCK